MLTKSIISLLVAGGVNFSAPNAHSDTNPVEGNEGPYGGGGVVCREQGEAVSAQILDLWEAQTFKKIPVTESEDSVEDQLHRALNVYQGSNDQLRSDVILVAQALYEQVELRGEGDIPPGLKIAPPTDMLSPFIPLPASGCGFEGIAAFDDTSDVFFADFSLYGLFTKTDRAALFFHESIYKYLREHYAVRNSIAARNITACVFADTPCSELSPKYGIPEEGDLYRCAPEGWTEAYKALPEFDPDNLYMGEPEFYVYRMANKIAELPVDGYFVWRFQQTAVNKPVSFPWATSHYENVPARSFFDIQMSALTTLDLGPEGRIKNSALSMKGSLDIVASTYSSDSKDPWRRSIGPKFVYHMKSSARPDFPSAPLEVNGFPLVCTKLR